jgi:hypothetical protein
MYEGCANAKIADATPTTRAKRKIQPFIQNPLLTVKSG